MTSDFIYDQVLKGCLKAGVSQSGSRNAAVLAAERYKKGRYTAKVGVFIQESIKQAKKIKAA